MENLETYKRTNEEIKQVMKETCDYLLGKLIKGEEETQSFSCYVEEANICLYLMSGKCSNKDLNIIELHLDGNCINLTLLDNSEILKLENNCEELFQRFSDNKEIVCEKILKKYKNGRME